MKRFYLIVGMVVSGFMVAFSAAVTPASDIPAYYSAADGKSGSQLWAAVSSATNKGFSTLGYSGLWTAYRTTDTYPTDPNSPDYMAGRAGKIWDMYGDCVFTYGSDQCGSYSGVCDCYNREHSIPKSWFGGSTSGIGCDIFHLVPTDGKINGVRSNYEFGEVNGGEDWNGNKFGSAGTWSTDKKTIASTAGEIINGSGTVFEPLDKYKGDFARGYLGTIVKWQLANMTSGNNMFSGQYDAAHFFGLTKKAVVLLMKWHREDPVSLKEINRNNGIQQTQGNRNPFIDYPYLAEYIWGEHAGETVNMAQLMPSTDPAFVPGVSNGWRGTTPTPEPVETVKYGVTWSVNGNPQSTDSVAENATITTLPTTPVGCSAESNIFVGWTDMPISGVQDNAPTVLYLAASDIPAITEDITLYAVFAAATEAPASTPATYTYNATSQVGWTNTANKKSGYWLLDSGKQLTSPEVELAGLSSINVRMRTYGGTQFDQLQIATVGSVLTTLSATKGGTMSDYSWTNTASLTGRAPIVFTCSNAGSDKGIGLESVTIQTLAAGISYSRYITSCQTPTEVETTRWHDEQPARKVIIGGQMYILVGEQLFTIMGQRAK